MPEETLATRALLNLRDQLQAISEERGYFHTLSRDSVSLDPNDVIAIVTGRQVKSPYLTIELPPTRMTFGRSDQLLESIPVNLIGFVLSNTADPLSRLQSYERLCADVEKAIHSDVRLGGLVMDTRILSRQYSYFGGTQRVTALIQIELRTYRFYGASSG